MTDLKHIHPGQITTEILRRFDSGEKGTFLLPGNYRMTIKEDDKRPEVFQVAGTIQAYCTHLL